MKTKSITGLILFLGLPFTFRWLPQGMIYHEVAFWLLFLFIMTWIYLIEKRTLASIGWKQIKWKTVFSGLGLGVVLFILFGVITTIIQTIGLELNQEVAQQIARQPFPMLLLIALRAGIVEEVLYRGYAFERIFDLTQSKWLAALVPVLIFMLAHLSWGIGHLVFVFFAGGLFMLLYIVKRNLPLLMIAHFMTDVLALLVLPVMLSQ